MVKIWKVVWGWFEWDKATRRLVAGNVREALEKAEKMAAPSAPGGDTKLDIISIELESESDEEEEIKND